MKCNQIKCTDLVQQCVIKKNMCDTIIDVYKTKSTFKINRSQKEYCFPEPIMFV